MIYAFSINFVYLRPSYVYSSGTEGEAMLFYEYFEDENDYSYENSKSMHTLQIIPHKIALCIWHPWRGDKDEEDDIHNDENYDKSANLD